MTRNTRLMKSKEQVSREQLADFLAAVAERIRTGELTLSQAGEPVTVQIPEQVRLDVEIEDAPKREGTKREIELEIHWYEGADGTPLPADRGGVTVV